MRTQFSINVDAPAHEVWQKLSRGFGDTGKWTSLIDSSSMVGEPDVGAHRECRIGDKVLTEEITRMDDLEMVVTYDLIEGRPFIVKQGTNSWSVNAHSENSCQLTMQPNIQMKWWAKPMEPLVAMSLKKSMPMVLEEFKHWAERGVAHPRKQKKQGNIAQLRPAA